MEDIELFQWVLLGLLAVGVIVLIALLGTLGGIKKALEQRSREAREPGTGGLQETSGYERAATYGATTSTETERPAAGDTYPPTDTTPATAAGPAASTGRAGSIRSVLAQHGMAETAEPAVSHTTEEQDETGVVDSVFAAHADDPQEEPFQRDGRWWFKRGDELLLYDEASGQWQPAPGDSSAAPAAAASPAATSGATTTGVQTTQVAAAPAVADQVSTFWKCPTCGAVNGSTAATCRMCFAARP